MKRWLNVLRTYFLSAGDMTKIIFFIKFYFILIFFIVFIDFIDNEF